MSEDIKSLIEKINREGVQAAEAKASQIEEQAERQAEEILAKARKEAERLLAAAGEKFKLMEGKQRQMLSQAGRDFLLSLRKEIAASIERLILQDVRQALGPEALHKILAEVIKNYGGQQKSEAVVLLRPEDADVLQQHYLAKLKEETKKGIILKPSGEISGGFTISFDAGRSQFDFTDQALADYIGAYLKPQLNEILKQAVSV
jgi:V/A-type H+-transporting ATPase subunit E